MERLYVCIAVVIILVSISEQSHPPPMFGYPEKEDSEISDQTRKVRDDVRDLLNEMDMMADNDETIQRGESIVCVVDGATYGVGQLIARKDCTLNCVCGSNGEQSCVPMCPSVKVECGPGEIDKVVYVQSFGGCTCPSTTCVTGEIVGRCTFVGGVKGTITLVGARNGPTRFTGRLSQLTPGKHAFHIHELGDVSDGCTSTGGHYNPFGTEHGQHVGDVVNIDADVNGNVEVDVKRENIQLSGPFSVIGRSITIHKGQDLLSPNADSDAVRVKDGKKRVGCCVIGLSNE